ncbi:tektin-3-like isoform X1 [Lineus longissimus]|uniref:tektin-3-like isoform X1 n=1 Tax=Lineus longissimus TaxID=88925 RepID=UPI002B4DD85B
MEYMGHTQTATYMTGPKMGSTSPTSLPNISTQQQSYRAYDSYPAPSPLRRSLTTIPYRPSTYYRTAQVNPTNPLAKSMPEPMSQAHNLSELDSIKVPPVFAAARNALYTRYTPNDWKQSNSAHYLGSDRVRSSAERLRFDTVRLCRETDDKTKRSQSDVGKRLGERIGDIQFWKTEVNHETDNMITEINSLQEQKRILEKALAETENPLHIAQECLYNREKRQGIDLVHDDVERQLIQEVDNIKQCQNKLRQKIDKANMQLSLCRGAQHELEKDSSDKFVANNLDEKCHGMRNSSRGLAYHNGINRVDNTVSVPESWAKFSNDNIQRSQSERNASKQLRNDMDNVLNNCSNDMWRQWNNVNVSFSERTGETTDARNKLQTHLSKDLQEIFNMEKNIEMLKKAIHDKEAPMQVAQSRLETRTHRPNVELCRDPVQHRLFSEVSEISETVENLQHQLRQAENTLQQLLRSKAQLEHDLAIKNNSLFIDREKCMGMRKTFPMSPRIASY